MRHNSLTTEQAIKILSEEGSIYWSDPFHIFGDTVDWLMVSIFFNTQEIHTYGNGMVTRIYL